MDYNRNHFKPSILPRNQYKTSKRGYLTKTQQQKGSAMFLSAKLSLISLIRRRLDEEISYTNWRHLHSTAAMTIVQHSH